MQQRKCEECGGSGVEMVATGHGEVREDPCHVCEGTGRLLDLAQAGASRPVPDRDAMYNRTDEQWDEIFDAISTVNGLRAGHTLTDDDIAALHLVDKTHRDDEETATDAYHRGLEEGLRERGGDELVRLEQRISTAIVERATERAMHRLAEQRANSAEFLLALIAQARLEGASRPGMPSNPKGAIQMSETEGLPITPTEYRYRYSDCWRVGTGGREINGSRPSESEGLYAERDVRRLLDLAQAGASRPVPSEDEIARAAWDASRKATLEDHEEDPGPWPPAAGACGWVEDDAECVREGKLREARAIRDLFGASRPVGAEERIAAMIVDHMSNGNLTLETCSGPHRMDALECAKALLSGSEAAGNGWRPPKGWKLVPEESTEEQDMAARGLIMMDRFGGPSEGYTLGQHAESGFYGEYWGHLLSDEERKISVRLSKAGLANMIYRAMIANGPAAPTPSGQEQGGGS